MDGGVAGAVAWMAASLAPQNAPAAAPVTTLLGVLRLAEEPHSVHRGALVGNDMPVAAMRQPVAAAPATTLAEVVGIAAAGSATLPRPGCLPEPVFSSPACPHPMRSLPIGVAPRLCLRKSHLCCPSHLHMSCP